MIDARRAFAFGLHPAEPLAGQPGRQTWRLLHVEHLVHRGFGEHPARPGAAAICRRRDEGHEARDRGAEHARRPIGKSDGRNRDKALRVDFIGRDAKPGRNIGEGPRQIIHAERAEQPALQIGPEIDAGNARADIAEQAIADVGIVIGPSRWRAGKAPGRRIMRSAGNQITAQEIAECERRIVAVRAEIHRIIGGIRDARHVHEKVARSNILLGRCRRNDREVEVAVDRRVDIQPSLLRQHHDPGGGNRFRHRREVKHRIDGDRPPHGNVGMPAGSRQQHFARSRKADGKACHPAAAPLVRKEAVEVFGGGRAGERWRRERNGRKRSGKKGSAARRGMDGSRQCGRRIIDHRPSM
jgi:hypothetical protein